MTLLRTLPVHAIVQQVYPRPPPEEKDHVAMAIGRAIDGTLTEFGHQYHQGRRPTATAMQAYGAALLDESLEEAGIRLSPTDRERLLGQLAEVVRAYRRSVLLGLSRPRTHLIVINGEVGVYAQPDYWDGRQRFYEMKSYPAIPPPPDVLLQLRLFQLAFPNLEAVLICLNRHATPVETTSWVVPPPSSEESAAVLQQAYDIGREFGEEKVLEYLAGPSVHYTVPASAPSPPAPRDPDPARTSDD